MCLVFQIIINFFITKHSVMYSVNDNKYAYNIEENFSITNKEHLYNFVITDSKKNIYTFNYSKDLNKQKNIITSIKTYTNNDLTCIVPIFKRNDFGNIYCSKDNIGLSYSYLANNEDFKVILKDINKDNYYRNNYGSSNKSKIFDNKTTYYEENIPANYRFVLWDYYGIDVFSNGEPKKQALLGNQDDYNNNYSTIVDKFYIALSEKSLNEIHYYNLKEDGENYIPVEEKLSGNFFMLGTYDKKLYFVDLESKNEYCLDPYRRTLKVVGNQSDGYLVLQGKSLENVESSLFNAKMNEYVFKKPTTNKKIDKKYGETEKFLSNKMYYFKTGDNTFYKSNIKYPDKAIVLFNVGVVSTWKVVDDTIIFVKDNSLYFYNDEYGMKKVLSNNELKYNYKNICDLYIVK